MSPRTYVGLARFHGPNTVALLFASHGTIKSVRVITRKITGHDSSTDLSMGLAKEPGEVILSGNVIFGTVRSPQNRGREERRKLCIPYFSASSWRRSLPGVEA